jgi:hypothetical protein
VHAHLDALVFESGEYSVDSTRVVFADLGVEEAGVDEAFGDAFFAGEELLALEATDVRKRCCMPYVFSRSRRIDPS